MIASSLLSDIIKPIRTSTTGRDALGLMNDMNVNHLPIVNDEQLLGVISSNDILANSVDEAVGSYGLMLKSAYLTDSDHLYEAMKLIGEHNLSLIPVVDNEKNYLGCITQDDLLRFFANIGSFTEPGSIIVLEMNKRDYSLAEISRIVEAENAANNYKS
jgi:CBS domain-containing protein